MMDIEDNFVTTDKDHFGNPVRFEMMEDESGDIFWAYGHVDPVKFVGEINRWLMHVGMDIMALIVDHSGVEHLYARMDEDGERFQIHGPTMTEADAHMFPVTRLML
jgi:hypothetical protein